MTRNQFIKKIKSINENYKVSTVFEDYTCGCESCGIKGSSNMYAVVCDFDVFDPMAALRDIEQKSYKVYGVTGNNGINQLTFGYKTYAEARSYAISFIC